MNLHRWELWEIKCSPWVCCSHGHTVRGFRPSVTSGKIMKSFGVLLADGKTLPVDWDDPKTHLLLPFYHTSLSSSCSSFHHNLNYSINCWTVSVPAASHSWPFFWGEVCDYDRQFISEHDTKCNRLLCFEKLWLLPGKEKCKKQAVLLKPRSAKGSHTGKVQNRPFGCN